MTMHIGKKPNAPKGWAWDKALVSGPSIPVVLSP